jgi:hypothetical protein
MNWYLEACPICGGSLHDDFDDRGWLTCFSCARSFAPGDARIDAFVGWQLNERGSSDRALAALQAPFEGH